MPDRTAAEKAPIFSQALRDSNLTTLHEPEVCTSLAACHLKDSTRFGPAARNVRASQVAKAGLQAAQEPNIWGPNAILIHPVSQPASKRATRDPRHHCAIGLRIRVLAKKEHKRTSGAISLSKAVGAWLVRPVPRILYC